MHREYEDLLLLYTTNSIDQAGRQRLEEHLQACEVCRASLREWRTISAAVRRSASHRADSLPALHLPEQEKKTMQSTRALPQRRYYVPVTFAAIAAMLLISAVVLFMRTPGTILTVFVQPTTADTVEIVMPTHPIRADRRIDSDDVTLVSVPAEVAPANRITALEAVIGKFTRTDIFCGQPLLSDMIAEYSPIVPAYHDFLEIDTAEACNVSPNPDDQWVNVVVASRAILQGETITEDMVELRPYPSQLIPTDAVLNIEDVIDQTAVMDIFEEQFITEQIISEFSPLRIPENTVQVPVLLADNAASIARENQYVDLTANISYIGDWQEWRLVTPETDGATSTSLQIAHNAFVLGFPMSENGEVDQDRLIVAVPLDEALVLSLLLEAEIPVTLTPVQDSASSPDSITTSQQILPDGTVAVSLPLRRATSVAYALQEQDRVDLIATLFFIDDEEGRRLLLTDAPGAAPVTIQMVTDARIVHIGEFPEGVYIGESPSQSGENSYDGDVITFAVSSQEAAILDWLITAEVPVTIALTGNTEFPRAETTIPDSLVPEGMEVVYVPLDRITLVYGQENVIDIYAPEVGELLEGTPVAPVLSADGSYLAPGEMVQVAQNAQIIPSSGRSSLLPVAVSPDEAELLRRLIENDFPLTLVDAGLIERTLDSTPIAPVEVPEGMVTVSVPRTLILAAPVGQFSDHVDILATLRFADVDEESQVLVPTGTPPDTQAVTQQVISNALQIPSDDPEMMTFVVSPEDAEVLAWLIEARIPLILVSPGSWNGDPLNIPTIP